MTPEEAKYFDLKHDSLVKLLDDRIRQEDQRHGENKQEFKDIKDKMICGVHGEKIRTLFSDTKRLWVCLWFVIGTFITGAVTGFIWYTINR